MAVLDTFGKRLRQARGDAGLSTRALAQRMTELGHRISHVTITKYERDEFSPTAETVCVIATALSKPVEWFESVSPNLSGVRFRALKTSHARDRAAFTSRAAPWLRLYDHVHQLLSRNDANGFAVDIAPECSGAEAARILRDKYALHNYPIPSVVRMLENADIRVIGQGGVAGIDAFAGKFGTLNVVVVNSQLPPDRMRLTLAHELGHVLFEDVMHDAEVDHDQLESRAFEFASHLLMPSPMLREAFELKSMVRLVQYKERFGISLAAMVYRATEENILPRAMAQRLWREFSRLGWRKREPGRVPSDHPVRMEALVENAVRSGQSTYAELSRISGLQVTEIRSRVVSAMGAAELSESGMDALSFKISAYRDSQ